MIIAPFNTNTANKRSSGYADMRQNGHSMWRYYGISQPRNTLMITYLFSVLSFIESTFKTTGFWLPTKI